MLSAARAFQFQVVIVAASLLSIFARVILHFSGVQHRSLNHRLVQVGNQPQRHSLTSTSSSLLPSGASQQSLRRLRAHIFSIDVVSKPCYNKQVKVLSDRYARGLG